MFLSLLAGLFVIYYFYIRSRFSFFSRRGVVQEPAYFPLGSAPTWKVFTGQLSFLRANDDLYKKYKGKKAVGHYGVLGEPLLLLLDLDLAKRVFIKDFDHFADRRDLGFAPDFDKYFSNMLINLKGDKWRVTRHSMSPLFTTSRLKALTPLINEVGDNMIDYLTANQNEASLDCKDIFQNYSVSIMASTGCGVRCNPFKNPDDIFYKMAIRMTGGGKPSLTQMMKSVLLLLMPKLGYALKLTVTDDEAKDFVCEVIKRELRERRASNTKKKDFLDVLSSVANEAESHEVTKDVGEQEEEDHEHDAKLKGHVESLSSYKMAPEEAETYVVSQALVLFFAGVDTTSTALSLVMHFLSKNQDAQDKLFAEIQEAVEDNKGSTALDYNVMHGLQYMEMVIKESLRMWSVGLLDRVCTKDYHIPELKYTVKKGEIVQVASSALMHEKKYFKNPKKFDPEGNFEGTNLIPQAFFSFGQGPRNCIGMRMAYTMMRAALVRIVYNFKILPSHKTPKEFVIDPANPAALPKGGLHMKIEERTK